MKITMKHGTIIHPTTPDHTPRSTHTLSHHIYQISFGAECANTTNSSQHLTSKTLITIQEHNWCSSPVVDGC